MSKVKKVKGKMATKEMIPTVLIPTVLIPTVLMAMICQKKVILTFTIVALIQMNGKYVFFFLLSLVKES